MDKIDWHTSTIILAIFCACLLTSCAVLPERLSGFKEPTTDETTDMEQAKRYAKDANQELLGLHDQYVLWEGTLTIAALGSGVAFAVATAFNGTKDLLSALGLAGGGLVAIDYASSTPQKIKLINEGREEI
ncbi:MAG: hypothetical protein JO189_01975 [Deltaproteobacteria bacterium]|nr:hypothetical protein [Deltaproteobacteria bacterium]